MILSVWHR